MSFRYSGKVVNYGIAVAVLLACFTGLELLLGAESVRHSLGLPKPGRWEWQINGYLRKDPDLIFSLRPDFSGQWHEPAFTVQVTTNSLGLRGGTIGPKSGDVKRILVVGDSMVFGWGASDDETFPSRMEDLLNVQGRHFEVINAGVQGYGTDQSYTLYKKRLAQLAPDLLIFCLFENDVQNNIGFPLYTIEDDTLVPLPVDNHPVYFLGRLREILPAFVRKTETYRVFAAVQANQKPYASLPVRDMEALRVWSKRKVNLQIADLQAQAAREGFQLLVVGLPYKPGKYTNPGAYEFVEAAGHDSLKLLDLSRLPVWGEKQQALFMAGYDPHTNLAGYQLIAELLAGHIQDQADAYFKRHGQLVRE